MRVAAVTPIRVPEEELARRQERYDRLAPPPLRVQLRNLDDPDAPTSLESEADVRRSEEIVAKVAADAAARSYDAVLPDCVLDPAVDRLAATSPVPVYGILRLTAGFLLGCGAAFGAVSRNQAIATELAERVGVYGMAGSYVRGAVLDLDFAAVSDGTRWDAALRGAVAGLAADGVRVVVNGCSAVELAGGWPDGVSVVDPTELALRLLAVGALQEVLV